MYNVSAVTIGPPAVYYIVGNFLRINFFKNSLCINYFGNSGLEYIKTYELMLTCWIMFIVQNMHIQEDN